MKTGYVYIMSNYKRTTFYIGVTNSLERRVLEHKQGLTPGFTQRYKLKYLVYYEVAASMWKAIAREKQLKNWHRDWKINLIKSVDPEMKDLSAELFGQESVGAETLNDPELISGQGRHDGESTVKSIPPYRGNPSCCHHQRMLPPCNLQ